MSLFRPLANACPEPMITVPASAVAPRSELLDGPVAPIGAARPGRGPARVDGKFFTRAGERLPIRGVTYGTFRPRADGLLFPEPPWIEHDLAAMARAGFNVVRTYVEPSEDLLRSASAHDLQVLAGIFWTDWRYLEGASRGQVRTMAREGADVVRRAAGRLLGNDDVFALCVGNEIPADVVRWVGERRIADLLRALVDAVRDVDPDRLVTYASYPSTECLVLEDLDFVTFNVFLERRDDFARYLTRLQHLTGDRPLLIGECGMDATGGAVAEATQAEIVAWQLETALDRGVAGTCLFSWTDEWAVGGVDVEDWHFGLTRTDRSARPALQVARSWNARSVEDLLPIEAWPSIAVVVCAYNAADTLDECLQHTCRLEYPDLEIIVVDDGSTDDTAGIATRHPRVRLVSVPHGGLSVARNAGWRAARSEIVAYLDADAYPSPEWPYYLALGFAREPVAGMGGPNVAPPTDPPGAQQVARAPGGPVHVLVTDDRAEHVPGCNMAFRRRVLEELDGFRAVFTSAGDDVDLCWRVIDVGQEIGFHPGALVWHHPRADVRGYLRQQRGYGRAEALVAGHHPERCNGWGQAQWRGSIYGGHRRPFGRARIHRGSFGTAGYQSVYRGRGGLDLADQVGVPAATALVISAPLGLVQPWLALPALAGAAFLAGLGALHAWRVRPPRGRGSVTRLRLGVAALTLAQPLARLWGRSRAARQARRQVEAPPPVGGPIHQLGRGVLLLPAPASRGELADAIVRALRRAGLPTRSATVWDDHDGSVVGSLLVAGELVTSAHPEGFVQLRVRRRARGASAAAVVVVAAIVGIGAPVLGAAVLAVAAAEVARGVWCTGPRVRAVVMRAARPS